MSLNNFGRLKISKRDKSNEKELFTETVILFAFLSIPVIIALVPKAPVPEVLDNF
jgi:hypothetical protein